MSIFVSRGYLSDYVFLHLPRSYLLSISTASAFPKPSLLSVEAGQGLKVYPEAERAAEGALNQETHTHLWLINLPLHLCVL